MQNIVILLMITYCMWGYIEFSGKMVAKLAGGVGGPSATAMGADMSGWVENKALTKVGLDKDSRNEMQAKARDRLQSMDKGPQGSMKPGNRHDRSPNGEGVEKLESGEK